MSAQRQYIGETEFSRIDVEINDDDPEEWPTVEVTVSAMYPDDERCIVLSMDEARCLIGALAWIVR